jgi:hypothetical protein
MRIVRRKTHLKCREGEGQQRAGRLSRVHAAVSQALARTIARNPRQKRQDGIDLLRRGPPERQSTSLDLFIRQIDQLTWVQEGKSSGLLTVSVT